MADDSVAEDLGKLAFGGAVGFVLYLVVTGLGFGGGGRGSGQGEGRGPVAESPSIEPPVAPPVAEPTRPKPPPARPKPPVRPKDQNRLSFVMTAPTQPPHTNPMVFQFVGDAAHPYSIGDLIARVKAGGRSDVVLKIRGDVLEGAATVARDAIKNAGLTLWDDQSSGAPRVSRVSGNDRGHYSSWRRSA